MWTTKINTFIELINQMKLWKPSYAPEFFLLASDPSFYIYPPCTFNAHKRNTKQAPTSVRISRHSDTIYVMLEVQNLGKKVTSNKIHLRCIFSTSSTRRIKCSTYDGSLRQDFKHILCAHKYKGVCTHVLVYTRINFIRPPWSNHKNRKLPLPPIFLCDQ